MKQVVNTEASESKIAFSSSTPSLDLSENEDHVNSIGKGAITPRSISFRIRNLNNSVKSKDGKRKGGHFRNHSLQPKFTNQLVSQQNISLSSIQFTSERNQ